MRIVHLFQTFDPAEHLIEQQRLPLVLLAHEDFVFAKLNLSDGCTSEPKPPRLQGKKECNSFLHRVVEKPWAQLRARLQILDRTSVLVRALEVHESALHDRDHWRRTARAIMSLYETEADVAAIAQKREQDRNDVSIPARGLLEMAICECPTVNGKALSSWDLDGLLARIALLIEVAADSDAIVGGLVAPDIELHPNGEDTMDRAFYRSVIDPFLS